MSKQLLEEAEAFSRLMAMKAKMNDLGEVEEASTERLLKHLRGSLADLAFAVEKEGNYVNVAGISADVASLAMKIMLAYRNGEVKA